MATEKVMAMQEKGQRKRKMKPNTVFKAEINDILANEKIKLCSKKQFTKIFQNVNFRIAIANSRNIKKMVIRKKI